ncbi:MAG: hypothetical protein LBS65_06930, partial [Desulfovibrio sp.]|nr:hypothetical protein [Desulfovibrio sp.]
MSLRGGQNGRRSQEIESTLGGGGNAAYSSLDNIISQDGIIDFLTAPKAGRRLFHAAMYRSKAETAQGFVDYVLNNASLNDKPFYHLRNVDETPVELGYSPVQHIVNHHPGFSEWERVSEVIEQGEALQLGKDFYSGGQAAVYVLPEGGTSLVVIASLKPANKSGSHPKRFVVLTAFRENSKAVEGWIEQRKRNAATYSSADGTPASPPARNGTALSNLSDGVEESITQIDEEVNILLGKDKTLFQFAGESSRMSAPVRANLARAQELAESGTSNNAICKKTGWFLGMDGRWRYEIPDNPEDVHIPTLSVSKKKFTLGQIYDNPELYRAYPQLQDMQVMVQRSSGDGAYYSPKKGWTHGTITIGMKEDAGALLHEIQHAIQDIEGFARGGSVTLFTDGDNGLSSEEQYLMLAGEIEARNTAMRAYTLNNEEDRRLVSPDLRSDAIVLFGGEQVAAMSVEHRGRDPRYAEQQAKFDAIQPLEANSKEIPKQRGEGFLQRLIEWAKERGILGKWKNNDKRWKNIEVSPNSIRSVAKHGTGDKKLAAILAIPKLIQNGIYLETTVRKEKLNSHVFASKIIVDRKPYIVGFVIREDVNGKRYYDHALTEIYEGQEIFAPGPVTVSARHGSGGMNATSETIESIVRKHLGVKPDFTMNAGTRNRGYVEFGPDQYRIVLGKDANLSTLIHETGHVFEEELRRIVASGQADERQVAANCITMADTFGNGYGGKWSAFDVWH